MKLLIVAAATASAISMASASLAQETGARAAASQGDGGEATGDIVVTARRRAESLQVVPVAVTAVTGEALQKQNILNTLDLPRVSPGLSTTPSGGVSRNLPLYTIRGQQQGEYLASTDPSVGIYYGDVIVQRSFGTDYNIFDLEQVEVLKGPQGTLFGRNTTGGNIIFRSKLPTNAFGGGMFLQTGSNNLVNVQGYVNLPLAEGIALRIAGNYRYQDGYIHNVAGATTRYSLDQPGGINSGELVTTPGRRNEDYRDSRGGAVRASLKIESGRFQNVTVGTYISSDEGGSGYRLSYVKPGSLAATALGLTAPGDFAAIQALPFYDTRADAQSYSKVKYSIVAANTTSFELSDEITLKNIFGYHKYDTVNFENIDGSAAQIHAYGARVYGEETSDEIQLIGSHPGLDWIVGAYYFDETGQNVSFSGYFLGPVLRGRQQPQSLYEQAKNKSKSLFASATKTLDFVSPDLSLTMGGRYTWDDRAVAFGTRRNIGLPNEVCALAANSGSYTQYNARFDPAACMETMDTSFSRFTYTASLDWKVSPGKLLYVATRKGYRSGGFGTRGTDPTGFGVYQPENVQDVELGFKGTWRLGGASLRTNLAAYYQDYKNIQRLLTFTPCALCSAQTVVQNAASARIYGGEFETVLSFGNWLELNGSIALVRPKYKDFEFGGVDYSATASFGGAIRNQYALGARINVPTPERIGAFAIQADWYRQGSRYNQNDLAPDPRALIPASEVTNLRFELNRIGGSSLSAGLAVTNLFDRKYLINIYSLINQAGYASSVAAPPRQWRFDLRFDF